MKLKKSAEIIPSDDGDDDFDDSDYDGDDGDYDYDGGDDSE